jgi:hypothetical protein
MEMLERSPPVPCSTNWNGAVASSSVRDLCSDASLALIEDVRAEAEFGLHEDEDEVTIEPEPGHRLILCRLQAARHASVVENALRLSQQNIEPGTGYQAIWDSRFRTLAVAPSPSLNKVFIVDRYAIEQHFHHNDNEALAEGVRFKTAFNEQVAEFQGVAERLSGLVEDFTQVRTFDAPEAPGSAEERERRDRSIIQSLDQRVPHGLDEDFRYKRPAVFTLDGVPFDGTHTWSQVYETLCRHLAKLKPAVFDQLPDNPDFISSRGNRAFSRQRDDLRVAADFGRGVFAETNLSANQIRDNIARLLGAFGLPRDAFAVFLREDRDAG